MSRRRALTMLKAIPGRTLRTLPRAKIRHLIKKVLVSNLRAPLPDPLKDENKPGSKPRKGSPGAGAIAGLVLGVLLSASAPAAVWWSVAAEPVGAGAGHSHGALAWGDYDRDGAQRNTYRYLPFTRTVKENQIGGGGNERS